MNGKHNCVEKRTDWSISMELDQEKQNQEAAERCRAHWHSALCGNWLPAAYRCWRTAGCWKKLFVK